MIGLRLGAWLKVQSLDGGGIVSSPRSIDSFSQELGVDMLEINARGNTRPSTFETPPR